MQFSFFPLTSFLSLPLNREASNLLLNNKKVDSFLFSSSKSIFYISKFVLALTR